MEGIDLLNIKLIVLGVVVALIGYVLSTTIFWNGMMIMGGATIDGVALVPQYQIPGIVGIIIGIGIVAFAFYKRK